MQTARFIRVLCQGAEMPPDELPKRRREGQGLVEYALVILLVALVAILGLGAFGAGVNGLFGQVVASF